jgi:hypothetical protein
MAGMLLPAPVMSVRVQLKALAVGALQFQPGPVGTPTMLTPVGRVSLTVTGVTVLPVVAPPKALTATVMA